jgi:hypothetical protein
MDPEGATNVDGQYIAISALRTLTAPVPWEGATQVTKVATQAFAEDGARTSFVVSWLDALIVMPCPLSAVLLQSVVTVLQGKCLLE